MARSAGWRPPFLSSVVQDIEDACTTLDKKGGLHPAERAIVHSSTNY